MAELLVSVRSAAEAEQALAGGATYIDVKEPARGALGRASPEQLASVRTAVGGRVPLSAACGELLEIIDEDGTCRVDFTGLQGFNYAKAGLAGCAGDPEWERNWRTLQRHLPPSVRLVAVAYGDWRAVAAPEPASIIPLATELRCPWLLIDTFNKSFTTLLDHLTEDELADCVARARQAGMRVALAGSLTEELLPRVAAVRPNVIAVRGAACEGGRQGNVTSECVRRLVEIVEQM